jgi:hypothetical protein
MEKSGENCTKVVQEVVQYVDKALKGELPKEQIEYVKEVFKIPKGLDNGDFMYYLADVFGGRI